MDPKLSMLFMLIGTIISLSHLGDENLAKTKLHWSKTKLHLSNVVSVLLLSLTSVGKT
jgi:multisubunit Na+/H+ antiporter MnhB subunit